MQEKIELNRIREFGDVIDDSIQFFKQNWKPLLKSYFAICGFFWLASLLLSFFNEVNTLHRIHHGQSPLSGTYFLALLFEYINFIVITLTVLSFISLYKEKGKEAPGVDEVWSFVKYYFFRIFGTYLVLTLAIIVGTFFCLLPGVYLAVTFSLTLPIMVIENSTLSYSFNRCFQLIKNNWWFTLGAIIVSNIILVVAMLAIVIPVVVIAFGATFLMNVNMLTTYSYATIIITHLLQFAYMFPIIVVTITYFSLAEQKDDGNLLQRINNIGVVTNSNLNNELTEEY